ncbi:DedA family protein [Myceligenerans xiligouense]|uniref:Membrane protein DedA with SNARE-associated domain n=1 Tax=Myceligenerans xiligouense TaxID=253184 RepID=A0A3N4YQF0_9MICO|nr:DedA family protein [Myceligenerans xiligouense]RPF22843.1 membrane protein DedA with SNARE-associated domain [Myceligenerans xiligouense]
MLEPIYAFLEALELWVLDLAASPWVYPAMFGFATVDGFFPPLPSESVLITLAVSAHSAGVPWLPLVLVMGALGAWTGDQIAYQIGTAIGTERVPFLRSERGRRIVARAERVLRRRGASFILAARYVPIGRVAVNMTAGAVRYPRRRFMIIAAIASVMWSLYSAGIGVLAAAWLGHDPLLAIGVGIVFGVTAGFAIDKVVMWFQRGRPDEDDEDPDHVAETSGERAAA